MGPDGCWDLNVYDLAILVRRIRTNLGLPCGQAYPKDLGAGWWFVALLKRLLRFGASNYEDMNAMKLIELITASSTFRKSSTQLFVREKNNLAKCIPVKLFVNLEVSVLTIYISLLINSETWQLPEARATAGSRK